MSISVFAIYFISLGVFLLDIIYNKFDLAACVKKIQLCHLIHFGRRNMAPLSIVVLFSTHVAACGRMKQRHH